MTKKNWKRHQQLSSNPNKRPPIHSLEDAMEHFHEECEVCHQPMVVHSFREARGRLRKFVSAHCENRSKERPCRNGWDSRIVYVYYLE